VIFKVENGSFAYSQKQKILNHINFEAEKGDVISILGPNGVGKTTLLKCMMGLLKWHQGNSSVNGVNISEIPSRQLWQKIAYVPQAKTSAFSYTTEEMILMGRSAHINIINQPKKEDYNKVEMAMKTVGIGYLKGKMCSKISGGELQMVLIARALTTEPEMLILDEPESNLDFKNQLIILEIVKELAKTKGISSIFNTHYPAHALKISNKTLILDKSGTCNFGNTKEVINHENMQKSFSVNVHIGKIEIDREYHDVVIPLSVL